MAKPIKATLASGTVVAVLIALWGWSFSLSGRLSAVEAKEQTNAELLKEIRDYSRDTDRRLSRIEGALGIAGERQ